MIKRLLLSAFLLLVLAGGWAAWKLNDRPVLEPYAGLFLPPSTTGRAELRLRFFGVSTLVFDDGNTAVMTDGFFSRPGKWRVLVGRVEPDRELIRRSLERSGVESLAAVVVAHSHYDHAMDAAEVARQTGALLVGSNSTANVGRGDGLADEQIHVLGGREELRFGDFRVELIPSRHFPHGQAMGEIRSPLVPPARATDYMEGGSYAILVRHRGRSLLLQASAGFVEGGLEGVKADVVLLGVGGLGKMSAGYREAYWREVVEATGARRVIPVHWDDFTLPVDRPLRAFPRLLDDLGSTMAFLRERTAGKGIELRLLPTWEPVDPF